MDDKFLFLLGVAIFWVPILIWRVVSGTTWIDYLPAIFVFIFLGWLLSLIGPIVGLVAIIIVQIGVFVFIFKKGRK